MRLAAPRPRSDSPLPLTNKIAVSSLAMVAAIFSILAFDARLRGLAEAAENDEAEDEDAEEEDVDIGGSDAGATV